MASPSSVRIRPIPPDRGRITAIGWLRIAVRVFALLMALALCFPLHFLWGLSRRPSPWPRRFFAMAAWIAGLRLHVHGRVYDGPCCHLANHVSWLDILVVGAATGTSFVSKAEVQSIPLIGALANLNRTVYVQRNDRLGVGDQIDVIRAAMERGQRVTLFPEGTTTGGRALLPFKSSLLKVLENPPADLMVQPVFLDYGPNSAAMAWVGEEHGLDNALRMLSALKAWPVTVHLLAPFDPEDFADRKAIAAAAHRALSDALDRVAPSGHAPNGDV